MSILDDTTAMNSLDKENMVNIIQNFHQQINTAIHASMEITLPAMGSIENIAVLGMGGSAIGGDLLCSCLANNASVPVVTIRAYEPPQWIGNKTLLLVSSYSGNTHETLSSLEKVMQRNPKVIVVTSGGKLAKMAQEKGWPLVSVPGGQPPRASMGYMFVPLWVLVARLGLTPDPKAGLQKMAESLALQATQWGYDVPSEKNPAKQLARKLFGHPIFVYGTEGPLTAAAYRWRGQIQENAKMLVSSHAFPEFCHNEITGYEKPQEYIKKAMVVILRDLEEPARHKAQVEASIEIMKHAAEEVIELYGEGEDRMIRAVSLIYFGDWVSYYLAMLNGVDPTSIQSIIAIKAAIDRQA